MSITTMVLVALDAWVTMLPTRPITFDGDTDLSWLSSAASSKPTLVSQAITWL